MVSKARLDLPEPESPVTTMSLSRGISTEMFFRLWTRAPCTAIVVRGAALPAPFGGGKVEGGTFFRFRFTPTLELIRWFPRVKEGEFLHQDVALLGEADGRRGLAEETLIREVLTCGGDAAHVEVPFEMRLDLVARAR